jgi:hypothetical protein
MHVECRIPSEVKHGEKCRTCSDPNPENIRYYSGHVLLVDTIYVNWSGMASRANMTSAPRRLVVEFPQDTQQLSNCSAVRAEVGECISVVFSTRTRH